MKEYLIYTQFEYMRTCIAMLGTLKMAKTKATELLKKNKAIHVEVFDVATNRRWYKAFNGSWKKHKKEK